MERFVLGHHEIELYNTQKQSSSLVLCHYANDGNDILEKCRQLNCKNFTLALIRNCCDEDDMSPYKIDQVQKFSGRADEYMKILSSSIVPEIEKRLLQKPQEYILVGYSLAGLFSIYTMYHTMLFSKIVSCSGSLWYPQFIDYVKENSLNYKPEKIYFSLGDLEKKTRNKLYQNVEKCTAEIEQMYASLGIKTTLEFNKGGHFQDINLRIAKGITWVLEE